VAITPAATNILYYSLRSFIHEPGEEARLIQVQGLRRRQTASERSRSPGKIDVDAQIIDLSKIRPPSTSTRAFHVPGIARLAEKPRSLIINIDYPARHGGVSHHLSSVALGRRRSLRGIYIMGQGGHAQRPPSVT